MCLVGRSSNGRTADSGSAYRGSNPCLPANPFSRLVPPSFLHISRSGRHAELPVHFPDVMLAQIPVGFLHPGDLGQAQLLRQPPLPGAKPPLTAPPRLRRASRDHLDPQPLQRPPHLAQPFRAHRPPRRRGVKKVARPIAVERAESPLPLDHFPQPGHHRARRFLLYQLRVVGLAGGVIDDLDQVIPALVLKPLMPTPVQVQQHPRQRPARSPLAMHASLPPLLHQPRPLQRPLHPRAAQLDTVRFLQLLAKVPYVQVRVLLLTEPQHLFRLRQGNPLGAGLQRLRKNSLTLSF